MTRSPTASASTASASTRSSRTRPSPRSSVACRSTSSATLNGRWSPTTACAETMSRVTRAWRPARAAAARLRRGRGGGEEGGERIVTAANKEIEPIEKAWNELAALVDTLGTEKLELTGSGRWAVKDHLAHIAAWELSLIGLLNGEDRLTAMGVPGAGEDTDAINEAIWLAHRHDSAEQALALSRGTHAALMERLGATSDADLR